jgi:hypothetical protein
MPHRSSPRPRAKPVRGSRDAQTPVFLASAVSTLFVEAVRRLSECRCRVPGGRLRSRQRPLAPRQPPLAPSFVVCGIRTLTFHTPCVPVPSDGVAIGRVLAVHSVLCVSVGLAKYRVFGTWFGPGLPDFRSSDGEPGAARANIRRTFSRPRVRAVWAAWVQSAMTTAWSLPALSVKDRKCPLFAVRSGTYQARPTIVRRVPAMVNFRAEHDNVALLAIGCEVQTEATAGGGGAYWFPAGRPGFAAAAGSWRDPLAAASAGERRGSSWPG